MPEINLDRISLRFILTALMKIAKKDVKGLYKKAEVGEVKNFIGLHVPYYAPESPEVEIDSVSEEVDFFVQKILGFLNT